VITAYGPRGDYTYRPTGDSLPVSTWRGEDVYRVHVLRHREHYPTQGCHGAPLERECVICLGSGRDWQYVDNDCGECNGSGRIRLDAPNRRDVP
jgi:hypothetical protein